MATCTARCLHKGMVWSLRLISFSALIQSNNFSLFGDSELKKFLCLGPSSENY